MIAVQQCMLIERPAVATLTYLTAAVSMWIFGIFLGQMALIAGETTTFEVLYVSCVSYIYCACIHTQRQIIT